MHAEIRTSGCPCGWHQAVLLRHDGHGAPHHDLLIAVGARCPTLSWPSSLRTPGATWLAPHRRRYLTFRGPIPGGRGRVALRWRGAVLVQRCGGGFLLRMAARRGAPAQGAITVSTLARVATFGLAATLVRR